MVRVFANLGSFALIAATLTTPAAARAEAPRFHWIQGGHASQVRAVAVSPDGQLAASASEDGTLKLWRVADGRLRSTLLTNEGQSFAANGVAFSPDGTLVAGTGTGGGRLCRVADGESLHALEGFETAYGVSFSADGQLVVIAGSITGTEEAAGVFRVSDGATIRIFEGTPQRYGISAVFTPDGLSFFLSSGSPFSPGQAGGIKQVRISDGMVLRNLSGHTGRVGTLALSPDGATLASGGEDATIRFWSAADGTLLHTIPAAHVGEVNHVVYSSDGASLASSGADAVTRIWRTSDHTLVRTISGHTGPVSSAAFTIDHSRLLTAGGRTFGGGGDNTIRLWNLADATALATFTQFTSRSPLLAYAPSADKVAISDGWEPVQILSAADGSMLQAIEPSTYVAALAITPDASRLAVAGGTTNGHIDLWNLATGMPYATITTSPPWSPFVAFSPDGQFVAAGSWDSGLKLYRANDGGFVRTFASSAPGGRDPVFSHDGTMLAAVNGVSALIWRVSDGSLLRAFPVSGLGAQRVVFSADDSRIATAGSGQTIWIFRVNDGGLVRSIDAGQFSTVHTIALTPDGAHILGASSYPGQRLDLWRISDGARVASIDQQNGTGVDFMQFAANGRRILLSRQDGVAAAMFNPLFPRCDADVNADGVVDLTDLAMQLAGFGNPSGESLATGDLDDDGDIDIGDLALLLAGFGTACP
jgi:WD40 repeat protein